MKIYRFLLLLGVCAALCACDTASNDEITQASPGTYILNNGNWGDNDSNIGIYNPSDKTFIADAFKTANLCLARNYLRIREKSIKCCPQPCQ